MGKKEKQRVQAFLDSDPSPDQFIEWLETRTLRVQDLPAVQQYLQAGPKDGFGSGLGNDPDIDTITDNDGTTHEGVIKVSDSDADSRLAQIGPFILDPLVDLIPHSSVLLDSINRASCPKLMSLNLGPQLIKIREGLEEHAIPEPGSGPDSEQNQSQRQMYTTKAAVVLALCDDILCEMSDFVAIKHFPIQETFFLIASLEKSIFRAPAIRSFIFPLIIRILAFYPAIVTDLAGPEGAETVVRLAYMVEFLFGNSDEGQLQSIGLGAAALLTLPTREAIIEKHKEMEATDEIYCLRRKALQAYASFLNKCGITPKILISQLYKYSTNPRAFNNLTASGLTPRAVLYIMLACCLDPLIPFDIGNPIDFDINELSLFPSHAALTGALIRDGVFAPSMDALLGLGLLCFHSSGPLFYKVDDAGLPGVFNYFSSLLNLIFVLPQTWATAWGPVGSQLLSHWAGFTTTALLAMPVCTFRPIFTIRMLSESANKPVQRSALIDWLREDMAWAIRAFHKANEEEARLENANDGDDADEVAEEGDGDLTTITTQQDPSLPLAFDPPVPKFYHNPAVLKRGSGERSAYGKEYGVDFALVYLPVALEEAAPHIFKIPPSVSLVSVLSDTPTTAGHGNGGSTGSGQFADPSLHAELSHTHKALTFLYFLLLQPKDVYSYLWIPKLLQSDAVSVFLKGTETMLTEGKGLPGNSAEVKERKSKLRLIEEVFTRVEEKIAERADEKNIVEQFRSQSARVMFKSI